MSEADKTSLQSTRAKGDAKAALQITSEVQSQDSGHISVLIKIDGGGIDLPEAVFHVAHAIQ